MRRRDRDRDRDEPVVDADSWLKAAQRHDIEAERAVLGTILLDNTALLAVEKTLRPDDFYHPAHGVIYESMARVAGRGEPIDIITLAGDLREGERLNTIGGAQYLGELTDSIATTAHVVTHAEIVANERRARRYAEHCMGQIARLGTGFRPDALVKDAQAKLPEFVRNETGALVPIDKFIVDAFERLEKTLENPTGVPGVPTGLRGYDRLTGGDTIGEMTIIAARPAMGKTSLMLERCIAAAMYEQRRAAAEGRPPWPVVIFSLEMDGVSLVWRILCSLARVDSNRLRTGMLTQDDLTALTRAANDVAGLSILVSESAETTAFEIMALCRDVRARHGGIVKLAIDYLQLVKTGMDFDDRQAEVTFICNAMLALTKGLGTCLDLLSQLNRDCEKRPGKRPILADLRESGSLEQNAHRVVFIHRAEVYDKNTEDRGIAEIILAKNRNGATDTVRCRFVNALTRFEDLSTDMDPFEQGQPVSTTFEGELLPDFQDG